MSATLEERVEELEAKVADLESQSTQADLIHYSATEIETAVTNALWLYNTTFAGSVTMIYASAISRWIATVPIPDGITTPIVAATIKDTVMTSSVPGLAYQISGNNIMFHFFAASRTNPYVVNYIIMEGDR